MEEDTKKRKVIWINEDIEKIDNEESEYTYLEFTLSLPGYDIIKSKSVKEAFDIIIKNYEDYKFKLFYVIVSGKLAEDFFKEYIVKSIELHILCATIIYCSEEERKENELKPFYLDNFLNPGKVTDSSYFIIEYIKSVQCPYYLESNDLNQKEKKEEEGKKENIDMESEKYDIDFAAEFTYVNDLASMIYPVIISKYLNCTLIEKEDLEKMQKENIKLYPNLKHLFKPSEEKNIFIPYHILAKYYLKIYTENSNFYINMNKELKEKQFDNHRTYIYLMYNALNKDIFKSYSQTNLYRGGTLSNEEFNSLMEKFEMQKNSKSSTNKIFFFSRKFLSFSKSEEVANDFLQTAIFCQFKGVYVRFIVEGNEDKDFFVSNIDINAMKLSDFNKEEEVLFLPLSCFEVVNIENENFYGYEIKVIRLNYLNKYKKYINDKFEELLKDKNEKKIEVFINNAVNSNYSKGICKYLGYNFNKKFNNEIRQNTKGLILLKNGLLLATQMIFSRIITYSLINIFICLGIIPASGIIIFIGGFSGLFFAFLEFKAIKKIKDIITKKELIFYSDSLYFKYVPQKFRELAIPILKWKNAPKNSKSFTIELIVNEDYKNPFWLIINIPAKKNKIEMNELLKGEGETIINYKGIPENSFSATFVLYVFNIDKINYHDFFNMKYGLKGEKKIKKNLINIKILIAS